MTQPIETTDQVVRPLSWLAMWLYPLRAALARGADGELLRYRHQLTLEARERARERKALKKILRREAKKFGKLVVDCWTRRGEAWIPKRGDPMLLMADVDGKATRRKRKIRRVKFARVKVSVERIYFQILVSSKTLLGHQNRLPFRVDVADLVSEESQFELQKQTERVISFAGSRIDDDPSKGVWVILDRLEGVGGLPGKVMFRSMTEHYPVDSTVAPIILGIGNPNRTIHMVDLARCFHVLIAGASGSGKSNILNAILSGWSMHVDPVDLRLILIDLKRLEFSFYKKSPHLFVPPEGSDCPAGVISTVEGAIQVLRYLLKEVHERTRLLEDHARELSAWNEMNPDRKLPRLVCVIDEFSELTLAINRKQRDEFRELVIRISQLSRAVGIHLVLCTQRPAVEVVPNAIKINMGLIIGGRTQNRDQSKVIIDGPECSKLPPVPGRMLYRFKPEIEEIQTPLCSDDDVRLAVRIAQTRAAGLVSWYGNHLAINRDAMVRFIIQACGLSCSGKQLKDALQARNYVVSKRQVDSFLEDMRAVTEIMIDGQRYTVALKGGSLRFTLVPLADTLALPDWVELLEAPADGDDRVSDQPESIDAVGSDQGDQLVIDQSPITVIPGQPSKAEIREARRQLAELRLARRKVTGNGNHE